MKKYHLYLFFIFSVFLFACNKNTSESGSNNKDTLAVINNNPSIIPIKGTTISSAQKPTIFPSKPPVQSDNSTNIKSAGNGLKIKSQNPLISNLGKPKIVPATLTKNIAGVPTVTQALPYRTRETNPQNIKYLDIEQGLKSSLIYSLIEDKNGGIWIGSKMGITKYDGKFLSHYGEKEGLVFNNVSSLLQDKTGNIWVGTRGGGLTKYDGKYFYNYKSDSILINNPINCIYEDKTGAIWLGTYMGAIKLQGDNFEIYSKEQGLTKYISSIIEDKNGNLCFSSYEEGMFILKNNKFHNYTEAQGLVDNIIRVSNIDNEGNIWFGGNSKGLSKFNGEYFENFTTEDGLSGNTIETIVFDKQKNVWIGTYGNGISKFSNNTFTYFSEKQGLNHQIIKTIVCGKNSEIWIGTEGAGIAKYDGDIFTHFTTNEGLSTNWVWTINQNKNKEFWFGTEGGGITILNSTKFSNYSTNEGLNQNVVLTTSIDQNNNFWIGTGGKGVAFFNGNSFTTYTTASGLANDLVWCSKIDKKGNVWFGTNGGISKFNGETFTNYTEKDGMKSNIIFSITEDKKGNMWFGSDGGGVLKYDGEKWYNYTEKNGLINNVISCIIEDSNGNMWFGSQNGGASRFDGTSFTSFTESQGLSNNAVLSMIEDNEKNIWMGTRGGINKLKKEFASLSKGEITNRKNLFVSYGIKEGFTGNNCVRNSVFKDNTGKIWWGTTKMLTCYNPSADNPDEAAPKMQITGLKLFFDDVNWSSFNSENKDSTVTKHEGITFDSVSYWNAMPINLNLPYHQNHVTINYIGINFKSQDKILYKYILDGAEDEWNPITNKTEAVYSNLPAGNFTFKVKAMNKDGVWSEPISYQFSVSPPWWKTWWFRTLAIILIVATVWFYIKQRERVLRQRQMELEQTVEERTHEVVEQKEIIEEKQKEILDSINYAKRIQRALLASTKLLNENLKSENNDATKAEDHFVYFQPKDIVSGDFYWASNLADGRFVIVTADSTGHGVPGAIMSMLNISCLNEAVNGKELTNAADILNHTRTKVISNLANDGSAEGGKDGMDCSVICYDFKNLKMNYAAANNPIWVVRKVANENGELVKTMIELKPDKMPCGKHDRDHEPFNSYEFDLQKGDLVYALTDGFPDQFGGEKGKKYMYKKLKEFLVENAHHPMQKQYKFLNAEFNYWKQDKEQVDDVLIIGVKV